MKGLKKVISVLLTVAMLMGFTALFASAEERQLNYLVLGDSIAEGFGVTNRAECAYGRIVADTNGYSYANLGRMGYDSSDLVRLLETNESYKSYVRWADIISISVGGNDFLLDNVPLLLTQSLIFKDFSRYDMLTQQYKENLDTIIKDIKELNPDAVILMQTIYNSWNSFAKSAYQAMLDRVNNVIRDYAQENPGAYEVVEVEPAVSFHKEYISTDTIHPNTLGNIEIAKLVLQKLYDLGLGQTTEPVILAEGIDRDYLNEYFEKELGFFGKIVGPVITFLANWATGNISNVLK